MAVDAILARGGPGLEVLTWLPTIRNGALILESLVLRERQEDGSTHYHVYRVIGRMDVAMYDVFVLPAGATKISPEDLKPLWPRDRDYNRA